MARVETWAFRQGKLVRVGQPDRVTRAPQSVTLTSGSPISLKVFTGGTEAAPLPYPTQSEDPVIRALAAKHPQVKWETLDPSYSLRNLDKWDELPDGQILRKLTSPAFVILPDGFRGGLRDFRDPLGPFSVFAPNCQGMWASHRDKAIWRLVPYSSTIVSQVPLQPEPGKASTNGDGTSNPFTMMRLGRQNGSISDFVLNYGWSMFGTNQPDQLANPLKEGTTRHPHNYSGYIDYMGSGSRTQFCRFGGVQADWQSPPGETFPYAMYKSKTQCVLEYSEVTGFNEGALASGAPPTDYQGASGERVGGGVGSNAAENPTYLYNDIHDAFVSSGPIVSGGGGPGGNLCFGGTIVGNKIHRNANHFPQATPGKQFGCFNNEGDIPGPNNTPLVVRDNDFVFTNNQAVLAQNHVFLGNWLADHPNIQLLRNRWQGPQFGSAPGTWVPGTVGPYGAPLIVNMTRIYSGQPNKQVTPPLVTHPDTGVVMQPVVRDATNGKGWPSGVDARNQYILVL